MSNVVISFSASGEKEEINKIIENMKNWYPEFEHEVTASHYNESLHLLSITFSGQWNGDIEEAIKLTHHAEALYSNTKCEHVHVEVCVDGKCYGSASSTF